ncbi:hypothetical protein RBH26_09870 [Natronolimnohabitans sp. A-GB9]|uniref:hypothetical protein n=1 Tax=Natronolimnohabitans sp. A-GB9 TaxID=3069757 RepID=UPI0027B0A5EC|nr:hypothetical protein [Natronolimnohabitans sp. A-GB9]MDQ2050792.1 hypothetical protein [Natronolimnohabitans sp. A-GB9]
MGASNQEVAELRAEMRAKMKELDQQIIELAEAYVEAHGGSVESDGEEGEETVNVEIPSAGRSRTNGDETVEIRRKKPDTYTEEVPVEGGDVENPDTITVERANHGPSVEDQMAFNEKINQMRSEDSRRRQERANQRRENQMSGAIPNYEYMNTDDGGVDESEIPVAGRRNRED